MGFASMLALILTHPLEARTLIQYKIYHDERDITDPQDFVATGWDRKSMRRCWEFLDQTSRSFAAVIKQVEGDMARAICLYYLVLRALDTIEDDTSLPDDVKQPVLRHFHEHTVTPGWTFTKNRPEEKDRQLLVEYNVVVEEMLLLDERYRDVIIDITKKMEVGMADFAHKEISTGCMSPETIADYDLYCHYVAGLVGEGLTRLWSASGKEQPWLKDQIVLGSSMGLMLQKTNIIRDIREDIDDGRLFWPREIFGREEYGKACGRSGFKEVKELVVPGNEQQALWVLSGMVLDCLSHATDCLDYLRLLKNQSIFTFCAIPQTMAMATIALVFMNPEMFQRNVKIRKAEAARLIMNSTNPRDVAYIFRDYARKIHAKLVPADPNYLRISVSCGKLEMWCEHHYPSFVRMIQSQGGSGATPSYDPADARTLIAQIAEKRDQELFIEKRKRDMAEKGIVPSPSQQEMTTVELLLYVGGAFSIIIILTLSIVYGLIWYLGDV